MSDSIKSKALPFLMVVVLSNAVVCFSIALGLGIFKMVETINHLVTRGVVNG